MLTSKSRLAMLWLLGAGLAMVSGAMLGLVSCPLPLPVVAGVVAGLAGGFLVGFATYAMATYSQRVLQRNCYYCGDDF